MCMLTIAAAQAVLALEWQPLDHLVGGHCLEPEGVTSMLLCFTFSLGTACGQI